MRHSRPVPRGERNTGRSQRLPAALTALVLAAALAGCSPGAVAAPPEAAAPTGGADTSSPAVSTPVPEVATPVPSSPAPATRHPAPAVAAPAPVPGTPSTGVAAQPEAQGRPLPKPGHVFIINLENKGYSKVWGAGSEAPYLSQTLRSQGVLLSEYYGTRTIPHPNYLAQISGQGPTPMTRDDCPTYCPVQADGNGRARPGEGHRLRVSGVGPHPRRAAQRGGQDLEGLHGGHGHALPASRYRAPRTITRGARRATSTPPGTTPSSTSSPSPRPRTARATWSTSAHCAGDLQSVATHAEPVLHHAQPLQRRPRQPLRRR